MIRKSKETPLNLIRILPYDKGPSLSKLPRAASGPFRIRIDVAETSRWTLWLDRVFVCFQAVLHGLGKVGQWSFHQMKRVITTWPIFCLQKIGQLAKFLGTQFINLAKAGGRGIQGAASQAWTSMMEPRKPRVIEPVNKERIRQREALIEEVHALRTQLSAHQDELIRVTAQMGELKALVLSQQQVLVHLGKELEATEEKETSSEKMTPRKAKIRPTKSAKPKKSESPEAPPPAQLELEPPNH